MSHRSNPHHRLAISLLLVLAIAAGPGCGDDNAQEQPLDAGVDAADARGDTGDAGDVGVDAQPASCTEPSVVEAREPTELDIGNWIVGSPTSSGSGELRRDIAQGTLEFPTAIGDQYGADWFAAAPGEDGSIERRGLSGTIYAAARVRVDEPTVVVARADGVYRFYANGVLQPGDVYAHGDKRVPIVLEPGTNTLVVMFGDQRPARVELFETPDALFFNTNDVTSPDLRVGHQTTQPIGISVLNLSGDVAHAVTATVVENDHFEQTEVTYPALAADATTQIGFELEPKSAWQTAEETIPVRLRLESCALDEAYELELELTTVAADATFKRTFVSPVDASVQYYGVVPPKDFEPGRNYAMVLSLHGAGVKGIGQARAYSPKEWAYVIAPTNRRRFGFDWEEWGRLNGLSALDDATEAFVVDPTKVYVTGHSMGGHGTWHLGVMHPGRFATVGPSAGWGSFYSYTGATRPTGATARARAHSDTLEYLSNLANRGAYIIHGSADNNVPVREGRAMRDAVSDYTDDVVYHEEEGAAHWWDGDVAEGADCVDWPDLFTFMQNHTLDPYELDFEFTTPGAWVSAEHSYVTIESCETPMQDCTLVSETTDTDQVTLTTTNVRSMVLDGEALGQKGIAEIVVDGTAEAVSDAPIELGPMDGKNREVSGPINQVFHRPFCFVYPDDGPAAYREYAAYLLSTWSLVGNGHGCALPVSLVTEQVRSERNLVYLGVSADEFAGDGERAFGWDGSTITIGEWDFDEAAAFVVFPEGDRLAAAFMVSEGYEHLLFRYQPFSSRSGMPDYLVWSEGGGLASGFFDAEWGFDESLGAR